MTIIELDGLTASPFDQSASATAQGTSHPTGTTGTMAQADELAIGAVEYIPPQSGVIITGWSDGFTQLVNVQTGATTADCEIGVASKTLSAVGTVETTATTSASTFFGEGLIVTYKLAPSGATLVVADASHGQTADAPALTQVHGLAVQDASHANAADNVVLGVVGDLGINNGTHGHTADELALAQESTLAVADGSHAHTVESLELTQGGSLGIDNGSHGHAAESVVLGQVHVLAVDASTLSHAAGALALTQLHSLVVGDGLHTHTAGSLVLGQFVGGLGDSYPERVAYTESAHVAFVEQATVHS